jgi:hypothetical protein
MSVSINIDLTESEWQEVEKEDRTETKALAIVKIYFRRQDTDVTFVPPGPGADLGVLLPEKSQLDIEVKGTEAQRITWSQIKVSSQQSYDRLSQGMPLYRITSIGQKRVSVYILYHGRDFSMKPEPRWSVHSLSDS